MSQSAHQWAVAELKRLNFDGDCDALAQYVEALIDNNRDTEDADPELLRRQVNSDLVDFIGEDRAKQFVDALIRHLSVNAAIAEPSPPSVVVPSVALGERITPASPVTPAPTSAPAPSPTPTPNPNPNPNPNPTPTSTSTPASARFEHRVRPPSPRRFFPEPPASSERPNAPLDHSRRTRSPRDRGDRGDETHLRNERERNRGRTSDRNQERTRDRNHARTHDRNHERASDRTHLTDRAPDRQPILDRIHDRNVDRERERERERERDHERPATWNATTAPRAARPSVISRLGSRVGTGEPPISHIQAPTPSFRDEREREREREREHVDRERGAAPRRGGAGDSMWRGRLGTRPGKRGRDDGDTIPEGSDLRAVKMPRPPADARRQAESIAGNPATFHTLFVQDRRASDGQPKPPHVPPFDRVTAGWPVPPEVMSHMPFPFPPFPPHPFPGRNGVGGGGVSGGAGRGGAGVGGAGAGAGAGAGSVAPGEMLTANGSKPMRTSGSHPNPGPGSRYKHFILLARNIPEDKMMIGPIISFFQRFGLLLDVVRAPPDRAFILFERRDHASAALSSVDAIMGNRHIRLAWARDNDFADAGLSLTDDGKLVSKDKQSDVGVASPARGGASGEDGTPQKMRMGRRGDGALRNGGTPSGARHGHADLGAHTGPRRMNESSATNLSGAPSVVAAPVQAGANGPVVTSQPGVVVDTKAAEEDLRRKKEKIVALRKEQEARRAQLQSRYEELVKEQKELLGQFGSVQDKDKAINLKTKLREVQKEAMKVRSELHPSTNVKTSSGGSGGGATGGAAATGIGNIAAGGAAKRFGKPDVSSFIVDNRPKNVLVSHVAADVSEEKAQAVFRETVRVAKVEDGLLIEFATRRAAESSLRAIGPLKRGFGAAATVQIVSTQLPAKGKSGVAKTPSLSTSPSVPTTTSRTASAKTNMILPQVAPPNGSASASAGHVPAPEPQPQVPLAATDDGAMTAVGTKPLGTAMASAMAAVSEDAMVD